MGRETFRKWCHEIDITKKAKKRRSRPRYKRTRMVPTGFVIADGWNTHRWFADRESCLFRSRSPLQSDSKPKPTYPSNTIGNLLQEQALFNNRSEFQCLIQSRFVSTKLRFNLMMCQTSFDIAFQFRKT